MFQSTRLSDQSPQCLLASLFRYPRGEMGELVSVMLVLIAVTLAGWLAAVLWSRFGGERTINNPSKLFKNLCRAHRLDHNQRRLLLALAQSHRLPQPAMLFLRPDLFNDSHLGPQLAAQATQVRLLRQRLFHAPPVPAKSSKPA